MIIWVEFSFSCIIMSYRSPLGYMHTIACWSHRFVKPDFNEICYFVTISACPSNCDTCVNVDGCTVCASGYYLQEATKKCIGNLSHILLECFEYKFPTFN